MPVRPTPGYNHLYVCTCNVAMDIYSSYMLLSMHCHTDIYKELWTASGVAMQTFACTPQINLVRIWLHQTWYVHHMLGKKSLVNGKLT